VEIVVKGRHTEVPDRFRQHAQSKLARVVKLDPKCFRLDAELSRERNPRLAGASDRIELTCYSRGPVIRAEAAAADPYAALDMASAKLEERLRRAADRRAARHSPHAHRVAGPPPAGSVVPPVPAPVADAAAGAGRLDGQPADTTAAEELVVRDKTHHAVPMTLDEALHQMELVGHDFYLYSDARSGLPSVVYRRRGYAYGVIRLVKEESGVAPGDPG
jgi:ribosomal subunit interface protein